MIRSARLTLTAAAIATLGLTLTACAGDGDDTLDYEDSPLSKYLGYEEDYDEEAWVAEAEENDKKIQELTAACMTEAGFEYTPWTGGVSYGTSDGYEWEPDDRAWVEQYGYGIINYPGKDEEDEVVPEEESDTDPNQAYVESLSESEQAAYYETLYGPEPGEEAYDDEDFDWDAWYDENGMGCSGDASEEVWGTDASSSEEFEPLMEAMNELYSTTTESAEMSELNAAWSSCMADAGYAGFTNQEDAQNSLYEELNAFWEEQSAEQADWTEEDWNNYDQDADEAYQAVEASVAEKEIDMALADLDCREETDYREKSLQIQFDLEEQFIQDHKAELDAYKAALEQDN